MWHQLQTDSGNALYATSLRSHKTLFGPQVRQVLRQSRRHAAGVQRAVSSQQQNNVQALCNVAAGQQRLQQSIQFCRRRFTGTRLPGCATSRLQVSYDDVSYTGSAVQPKQVDELRGKRSAVVQWCDKLCSSCAGAGSDRSDPGDDDHSAGASSAIAARHSARNVPQVLGALRKRGCSVEQAQQLRNAVCSRSVVVERRVLCPERHKAAAASTCSVVQCSELCLQSGAGVMCCHRALAQQAHPPALNSFHHALGKQYKAPRRRLLARRRLRRRAALLGARMHLRGASCSAHAPAAARAAAHTLPQEHAQPLKPARRMTSLSAQRP